MFGRIFLLRAGALCLVTTFTLGVPHNCLAQALGRADEDAFVVRLAVVALIAIVVFFLPTLIAFYRRHPNRWLIFVINTVFGGTGLGWLGSLVWAFRIAQVSEKGSNGGESGLNLFINDEVRVKLEQDQLGLPGPDDTLGQLQKLKSLFSDGVISEDEFSRLKAPLIEKLLS